MPLHLTALFLSPIHTPSFQPLCQQRLAQVARRQTEYDIHNVGFGSNNLPPIQTKEHVHRHERRPLIAVGKGVVLRDRESVCGRKFENGRLTVAISPFMVRPGQR